MVGEAYDHLMAVVVLGVIFIAAVFVVPNLSYVNLLYLDQQQLNNVALSAMNTILFDAGYPANWGSMSGINMFNGSLVKRFGLALQNPPSLYVLDQNKVLRLTDNPMGNISYQRVKDLLGLSGYDFSIIMRPLYDVHKYVSISYPTQQSVSVNFNVNVSRYDGQPVPNAMLSTYIIYAMDTSPPSTNVAQYKTMTNALGQTGPITQSVNANARILDVVVFFKVTVGDRSTLVVQSQNTRGPSNIALNVVGDSVILTMPPDTPNPGNTWVTSIQMYNFETAISLLNGTGTGSDNNLNYGGQSVWNGTFSGLSSEPELLILTLRTLGPPRTMRLLIGPYSLWQQGGIIQFNAAPVSSGSSAVVQRDVIISGMAYVAELRLWKSS